MQSHERNEYSGAFRLLMASDVKRSRYCMISLSIFAHQTTLLYTLRKVATGKHGHTETGMEMGTETETSYKLSYKLSSPVLLSEPELESNAKGSTEC